MSNTFLGAKIIVFISGGIAFTILWLKFVTERAPHRVWHLPYTLSPIAIWIIGSLLIVAGLVWAVV
jgi:uncharacterized membrane protein